MYPLYWTTSEGGIFMRYSFEFKKMCVELFRQGKWAETPPGIKQGSFRQKIRLWFRIANACGPEALQHKNQNKIWTAEEKMELVAKVLEGASIKSVAVNAGISDSLLYQWVRQYKINGYNGLANQRKGRPPKEPTMRKKELPAELTVTEREELLRLKARVEYLEAENEIIKKEIALREEKWEEQLKAKKQRSSKKPNSKDTN